MFDKKAFVGKKIIVTGGNRGIGRAIVELFAETGAEVTFFYRQNESEAKDFTLSCQAKNLSVSALQVDVRNKQQCEMAIEQIYQQQKRIDILVNNSGIVRDGLLASLSESEITDVIDTNLMGVFHVTQAVIPYMMSQRSGKIINISSVAAEKGGRGQCNYAASKGAINSLTKTLAVELAKKNITVNAVAPGVIETAMSSQVRESATEEALSKIALKRFGKPMDVAYAVAFLASSCADYITGEILHVDGGFKMA